MKKTKRSIMFLGIICILFITPGCRQIENTPAEVEWSVLADSIQENGVVVMEYEIVYPIVSLPNDFDEDLNRIFHEEAQKYLSSVLDQGVEDAQRDYQYAQTNNLPFYPHQYSMSCEVGMNDGKYLSALFSYDEYAGGAHGDSRWKAWTFSLEKGFQMGMEEVMGKEMDVAFEEIMAFVRSDARKRVESGELYLYEEYAELLESAFVVEDFYLTQTSCRIFYQPYSIAPYASGFVYFDLPLEQTALY